MSKPTKTYWQGLPELKNDPQVIKNAEKEFGDDPGHSRRDFLKMMGFSVAAASLAACEAPVRKAIPYVNKPVDVDPGIPNFYASTYVNGGDYCSIVVKTREGRPIKIEGNTLSSVTKGGVSAQVEASVLSLYDNYRLRGPKVADKSADWETLDKEVISKLSTVAQQGGAIKIISNTIISPSTFAAIAKFKAKYPTAEHVQYDPVSYYGIWKGNEASFGQGFIPSYDFSQAKTVVGISADFLGTWLAPIEFSKGYAATREVSEDKREMSRHYQFESNLSLTGANADYRTMIKPSQEGLVVAQLYNLIAAKAGKPSVSAGIDKIQYLDKAAEELWNNRGKSVVVCGSNDSAVQVLVNAINEALGNYGVTIFPNNPVLYRKGNDEQMASFVTDVKEGRVGAVIFFNANPVYDHPMGAELATALKNVSLTVSTSYTEDETAFACGYKAPDHHYLESWNDFEPKPNHYSLAQPTITPIFKTRAAQESFLVWAGESNTDYFEFVKQNWINSFFAKAGGILDAQLFWDKSLYDGVLEFPVNAYTPVAFTGDVNAAAGSISKTYEANNQGFEVVVHESCTVGNGAMANNPLLQELPDPITKAVWDHYVTISQKDAQALELDNDAEGHTKLLAITANGKTLNLPALIQPGQAPGTVGIALGYGRTKVGKAAENIGLNAYPFLRLSNGTLSYAITNGVTVEKTPSDFQIAQTQIHHTHMNRGSVIQETTLHQFAEDPYSGREIPKITDWEKKVDANSLNIWHGHDYKNHHWGMAIDLNTCTGCGACVVACNVENNVALVGKEEVLMRREMHWLRIDRYYSSSAPAEDRKGLEKAAENPEVVFQPMLCQHCNNAPCETVCPVAATTHSSEGLNQMTYNRCIGTRYCANNCPYKVRRFNWFKYHDNQQFYQPNPAMNTDLGRMVLNPDVTVRSRGVMEKCSFCVQRIQGGKLNAKKERRKLKDGEVVTACAAACTTGAIVFGDMNDPESKVRKLLKLEDIPTRPTYYDKLSKNPRAYRVIEEIGTKPNIFYLSKVRNKDEKKEHA